jgi:hypothetical protein
VSTFKAIRYFLDVTSTGSVAFVRGVSMTVDGVCLSFGDRFLLCLFVILPRLSPRHVICCPDKDAWRKRDC